MKILNHRESDGSCSDCGKVKELRPYGKAGKWVCFDCMMKDEEEGKRRFKAVLDSDDVIVLDIRGLPPAPAPGQEPLGGDIIEIDEDGTVHYKGKSGTFLENVPLRDPEGTY